MVLHFKKRTNKQSKGTILLSYTDALFFLASVCPERGFVGQRRSLPQGCSSLLPYGEEERFHIMLWHPEKDFQNNTHFVSQGFSFFLISIKSLALATHPSGLARARAGEETGYKAKAIISGSRKERWEGERGVSKEAMCAAVLPRPLGMGAGVLGSRKRELESRARPALGIQGCVLRTR